MIRSTLLAVGLFAHLSAAETLLVPEQYPTIQSAINAAAPSGDEISVASGTYSERLSINTSDIQGIKVFARTGKGSVSITPGDRGLIGPCIDVFGSTFPNETIIFEDLSITDFTYDPSDPAGASACRARGTNASPNLGAGVLFKGMSFTNCSAENYVGLYGIYENCIFSGCNGNNGGYLIHPGSLIDQNSIPEVVNCTFEGCTNLSLLMEANYIEGCTFQNCESSRLLTLRGGSIKNCVFLQNNHYSRLVDFDEGIIQSCTFTQNTFSGEYGAYVGSTVDCTGNGDHIIQECHFQDNTASRGGAIAMIGAGLLYLQNTNISLNTAQLVGGAIYKPSGGSIFSANVEGCGNFPNDWGNLLDNCESEINCCLGEACLTLSPSACNAAGGVEITGLCNTDCPNEGSCCLDGSCIETTIETCFELNGSYAGFGSTCLEVACSPNCEGDITGNGDVGLTDLIAVLSNWGPCPE